MGSGMIHDEYVAVTPPAVTAGPLQRAGGRNAPFFAAMLDMATRDTAAATVFAANQVFWR